MKIKRFREVPDEVAVKFRHLWRSGMLCADIAKELGITRRQVSTLRDKLSMGAHPEWRSGNGKRKYGHDVVEKIRELRLGEKKTNTEIGLILGIPRKQVSNLFHGKRLHDLLDEPRSIVPKHVLAERASRRALSPRDLTAAIFGDPLPGYSALERRA